MIQVSILPQWCQACRTILHGGSQLHHTVPIKVNYSLIDLAHHRPVIRSRSCDKAVTGRVQCAYTSEDLPEMVVQECTDFPKAPCKHLSLHCLPPFAIQVVFVGYAH